MSHRHTANVSNRWYESGVVIWRLARNEGVAIKDEEVQRLDNGIYLDG